VVLMILFYTLSPNPQETFTRLPSRSPSPITVKRDGGVMTATTGPENGFDRAPCVTNVSLETWRTLRFESSPHRGEILIKSMCDGGVYGVYIWSMMYKNLPAHRRCRLFIYIDIFVQREN